MQWIDCEKKLVYIFLRMIDINDKFNICSTINYYNGRHIKDNIYEAEAKGNYFRLVTLKTVHPNHREFRSYDIAGTLDKLYVLAGNSLQDWIRQHQLVIGHRLNQELLSILCNILFFCVFSFFINFSNTLRASMCSG